MERLKFLFKYLLKIVIIFAVVLVVGLIASAIIFGLSDTPEAMSDHTEVPDVVNADLIAKAEGGSPRAQYYLAKYYHEGKGADIDHNEATKWYNKSADQQWILAEFELGKFYYWGIGVDKNYKEAVRLFKLFDEHEGGRENNYMLGLCYLNGHGIKQDKAEGIRLIQEAADKKNINGQYQLGECYYNGNGVDKDYSQAFKWLEKSAVKGHTGAQTRLAECYKLGRGVKQDNEKAREWYAKAAKFGNGEAVKALVEMGEPVTTY